MDVITYALSRKIGHSFTTNKDVGNMPSGTIIDSSDKVGDILYEILYGQPTGQTVDIYYGATDSEPTGIEGLSVLQNQSIDQITTSGLKNLLIKAGTGSGATAKGQFPVIACDKDKVKLTRWSVSGFDYPLEFNSDVKGELNIYYLKSKSYDIPDGIKYNLNFQKM